MCNEFGARRYVSSPCDGCGELAFVAPWAMTEPAPPKSGLSPAAWSAIAAIVVAVIGGVVTLTTSWWQHAPPKAPPAPIATPPPATAATTAADPASWAGGWMGAAQAPGEEPYTVRVTLTRECALNAVCGTIRVPKCAGRLTLARLSDGAAEFNVDDFDASSDPAACKPGGGEVLKALPDGTLAYTATYSGATGVLRRP
jgi:hypothetical protein